MAVYVLPTSTDTAHYTFETDLENVTFNFGFRWNDRAAAWFMDISTADGTPLLSSRRVVVGLPLLARFRDPRLPVGELIAVDTSGQLLEPGVNDLGERVQLLYYDSTDNPLAV